MIILNFFPAPKKMSVTLNTNGVLLNEKNIKRSLAAQPDNINISLDGVNPQTHDRIRGLNGSFHITVNNIKSLSIKRNQNKSATSITLITCVSKYNINQIESLALLSKNLGADKIGFLPLHFLPPVDTSSTWSKNPNTLSCHPEPAIRQLAEAKDLNYYWEKNFCIRFSV